MSVTRITKEKELILDVSAKTAEEIYDLIIKIKPLMESIAEVLPPIIAKRKLEEKEITIWYKFLELILSFQNKVDGIIKILFAISGKHRVGRDKLKDLESRL